jgi:protein phosphatase
MGRVHSENEDFAHVSISNANRRPARALLIVADGWVGGDGDIGAGRVASELVVNTIREELQDLLHQPKPDPETTTSLLVERLLLAITIANQDLCIHDGRWGVVTGLACVLIQNDLAAIVNNAAARVYVLRNTQLRLITDNFPWSSGIEGAMYAYGALMGQVAEIQINYWARPNKNDAEFRRNASSTAAVQLNAWAEELQAGDRLLLCTDGLWGQVEESNIARCLSESDSPHMVVQRLINAANAYGGVDNTTVIVCDVIPE